MTDIVKKEGELDKMVTPWDSDNIMMVDVGCFERGCVCVASEWAAGAKPECVPVVEYKGAVGKLGAKPVAYRLNVAGIWHFIDAEHAQRIPEECEPLYTALELK